METSSVLWGVIALLVGIFVCSYGNVLFRFVLAFIGFAIGFSIMMWLGDVFSLPLQIVLAIVVGGILAAVFYTVFKFALYVAGGLMGFVIMLSLLSLFHIGGMDLNWIGWILVLAAAGVGAFFARRLGDIVIVISTALIGSYFVVLGVLNIFLGNILAIREEMADPLLLLGAGFPLVLFLTIALISGLAQYQAFSFRRRVLT
jgi:hypothetical protein